MGHALSVTSKRGTHMAHFSPEILPTFPLPLASLCAVFARPCGGHLFSRPCGIIIEVSMSTVHLCPALFIRAEQGKVHTCPVATSVPLHSPCTRCMRQPAPAVTRLRAAWQLPHAPSAPHQGAPHRCMACLSPGSGTSHKPTQGDRPHSNDGTVMQGASQ